MEKVMMPKVGDWKRRGPYVSLSVGYIYRQLDAVATWDAFFTHSWTVKLAVQSADIMQ